MTKIGIAATAVAVLSFGAASASGSGPGSIPVTTVTTPTAGTTEYQMASSSMEPTIHCGRPGFGCLGAADDRLLVQSPAGKIARFDVLLFQAPPRAASVCGTRGVFVSRVIGVPGDTWTEKNGFVYIDGKKLDEPFIKPAFRDHFTYLRAPPLYGVGHLTYSTARIPVGDYLMMGDNRAGSCDSRRFGLVPQSAVVGKLIGIKRYA